MKSGSGIIDDFFCALSFLTRVPVRSTYHSFSESFLFFPLVGLLIGTMNFALLYASSKLFTLPIAGYICVAFDTWITRGLHYDGFADWIDALGGGYTVEKRLDILKDSNVGVFAVIGLVICLFLKASAFSFFAEKGFWYPVIVSPAFSRFSMVALVPNMASARKGKGLGGSFVSSFKITILWLSFFTLFPCVLFAPILFSVMLIFTVFLIFLTRWMHNKYFGGLTGDLFGATCQLTEVVLLLVATGMLKK